MYRLLSSLSHTLWWQYKWMFSCIELSFVAIQLMHLFTQENLCIFQYIKT